MQKWEYRTVTFYASSQGAAPQVITIDDKELINGGWFKWVEDEPIPEWVAGNPTRAEYFTALGEEGWELFYYGPTEAIFKRPKTTSDKPATDSPSPAEDEFEDEGYMTTSDEPATDSPSPWE